MTTASHTGTGSDQDQNPLGVPFRHAFTINNSATLADGTKLLQIRNPWGSETYHGPWSDKSDLWDDATREQVGLEVEDDGLWWMTAKDYHENFQFTSGNPDVRDQHLSYWAGLDLKLGKEYFDEFVVTSNDD